MKKYGGAMVRKSFQVVIAAEIEHFENKSSGTNKTHLPGALNKNKTIFFDAVYSYAYIIQLFQYVFGVKANTGISGTIRSLGPLLTVEWVQLTERSTHTHPSPRRGGRDLGPAK